MKLKWPGDWLGEVREIREGTKDIRVPMIKINSFGKTDVGLVRKNNEDALILKPELGFWAVADGMGGEERGEVASQIFVDTALELFSGFSGRSEEEVRQRVQKTFDLANERILDWANKNRVEKMGCTAELLAFYASDYVIGHVGDSRTYLFRQGELRQITRDHSWVQAQIDQGLLTPAEAQRSPLRNIILRAVGTENSLVVDLLSGKSMPGDLYLLCSDGLTSMIDDLIIQGILSRPLGLSQKVDHLIERSKTAGGYDNITVILCEVMAS